MQIADSVWADRGVVAVPGGAIAYARRGEGKPIVLLHMLGGWIENWRHIAPHLPGALTAMDLPGHGDSTMAEPDWAYPLPDAASSIAAAMDALDIPSADFVGNSLGGCVAMALAIQAPERVKSLALLSVAMGPGRTREQIEKGEAREESWFNPDGTPKPRDPELIARISGTLDLALGNEQNESRARAGRWIQFSERGVGMGGLQEMLAKIRQPVALVYGERDPLRQRFEADALSRLPNGRTVVVPGAGRFPHMENAAATALALASFLGDVA